MNQSTYRPIEAARFKAPAAAPKPGAAPMLQWIKVEQLVIDDRYQRPIQGAGQKSVQRIAESFAWAKFAPVIVAPVEGGRFAVIDGQHRSTAAALLGIESVPCQVIIADTAEQAAAFASINGQVTRMHRLALQHAALEAGDEGAKRIAEICTAAGVTVLRYPRTADRMRPGETMALTSLIECERTYGRDVLITALMCVTETENNRPGLLRPAIIKALCAFLAGNEAWRDGGGALLAAFDAIDLEIELEEASLTRRAKGVGTWEVLTDRLRVSLRDALAEAARDR